MAVKIRLRRMGSRNAAFYRVIVQDSRRAPTGRFIETLGWYDPKKEGNNFSLNLDRVDYWLGNGAQPSDTAASLIKKARTMPVEQAVTGEVKEEEVSAVAVEADANLPADEVISNIAWLAVPDGFTLASESVEVSIGVLSDLRITKTVTEDIASIGDTVHYTITVFNTGNVFSTGTVVHDTLPEHTEFVSASLGGSLTNGVVSWSLDDLAEDDSTRLTLALMIKETMPANAELRNTASVVNDLGAADVASVVSTANPWVQTITKWAADGEYGYEDTVAFVITIDNVSPDPVHAIVVRDTLPEPLRFVSATHDGVFEDGVVIWNLGTLNAGNVLTLNVITTVGSLLEARPEITNRAWISTANAGCSFSDHIVSLAAFPELSLEKLAPASVLAGDSLVYTFIMHNTGNSMAHDVVLTDTLSSYLSYGSTSRDFFYDEATHSIFWNINELASGASDTLRLTTYVDYPVLNGTIFENTAYLSCVEGSAAQASAITEILSSPGLFVGIQGRTEVVAGDTIVYAISYNNKGTEIASSVVLTDTLSPLVEFIASSPVAGFDAESGIVNWNLADMVPGDSGFVSLTVRIRDEINYSVQVLNTARIACAQGDEAVNSHIANVRAPLLDIELVGDTTYIQAGEVTRPAVKLAEVAPV